LAALVGIDLGTTNTKVSAYDFNGNLLASASRKTAITYHENGWSEFDVEAIWESVYECLGEVSAACNGEISAIGLSSFGESNILLDQDGHPVFPMITWFDPRTTDEVRQLADILSPQEIHNITGQFASPKLGICKIMWIRNHYPEAYNKATVCLSMLDYILFRLTGTTGMDYTMAARMMLLDVRSLNYAAPVLKASGLRPDLFPKIRPSGCVAGHVMPTLRQQLGLVGEVPVLAGGHDHSCAAVAAHIFDEGVVLDSMGTAETTLMASDTLPDFALCYQNQVSIYPHFGSKLYRLTTSIQACGVCLSWANSQLLGDTGEKGESLSNLAPLLSQALATPRKRQLMFCPNIRGLQEAPSARGAFFGITDTCTREDFAYAVAEGLSFEAYRRLCGCLAGTNLEIQSIRVAGGPSFLQDLMQMKADIFDREIQIPVIRDAASLGAAVIAGLGSGLLQEPPQMLIQDRYVPVPAETACYRRRYPLYEKALSIMLQYHVPD
jgi:Sugar (pentulose and hexulose) kinases